MSNMNARNRKKLYPHIASRDGERCFICHEKGTIDAFVIDHWDNNSNNNVESNLHLLCRGCNARKNPHGPSRRGLSAKSKIDGGHNEHSPMYVSVCVSEPEEKRIISAEFEKNKECEPKFRRWLMNEIIQKTRVEYAHVIDSGAESSCCSQETIKRYLRKLTSTDGIYEIVTDLGEAPRKLVQFKKAWESALDKKKLAEIVKNWKRA